jgi:HlyD family secretion protein
LHKWENIIFMKISLLFFCFLLFFSCKKKQEKILPTVENITESVYASGIVKSKNQYKVFSTVNGLVIDVLVTDGDIVKKGDVLIKISNTTAALNTENAKIVADYNALNANAERLNELKINISLAKAKMEEDASLQQRQQNLWSENIGSRYELEQRQLAYKNSATAYEAARLRYAQLQKQTQFQEMQSKKNVEISSAIKNDYSIKSNADGKVYNILMKKGEMVNTLTPVAIVGDVKNFEMELQVDEYDIAKIKIGQKMVLNMDSYKGQVFEAVVKKINPAMNERTKSFTIYADFVSLLNNLFPNLTCEANIIITEKEKAVTIPRSYLMNDDYVLLTNKEKRKVTVGLKDYQKVEIITGLNASEFIVKPD